MARLLIITRVINSFLELNILRTMFWNVLPQVFLFLHGETKFHKMRGVNIGKNVYIGYNVLFDRLHPELITIGDYVEIGDWCIFSAHTRGSLTTRQAYPRTEKPIKIGRGVCINSRCIITQGVEIGENSIIEIGSVVTRNIPPNSFAMGYPAKVVKKLDGVGELQT